MEFIFHFHWTVGTCSALYGCWGSCISALLNYNVVSTDSKPCWGPVISIGKCFKIILKMKAGLKSFSV